MTLRLTSLSVPTVPDGAHQGFKQGASTELDHHAGFGVGDHYTLEVQTPGRMRILPGATTVVWYVAPDADGGFTAAEIEAAESLASGTVTEAWLRTQTTTAYGLQSDLPLEFSDFASIGRELRRWYETNGDGTSPWFMFKKGNTYTDFLEYWLGESALHPTLIGDFGTGDRPVFTGSDTVILRDPSPDHAVIQGINYGGLVGWNIGNNHKNLLISDCYCDTDDHGFEFDQINRSTIYASSIVDNIIEVPFDGTSWDDRDDRMSGVFNQRSDAFLSWGVFFDHSAWADDYNPDGVTYNAGEFGQPPTFYSHNWYAQYNNGDQTALGVISTRAAFSAHQARSGSYTNLEIRSENNAGGIFSQGSTGILRNNKVGTFQNGETIRGLTSLKEYVLNTENADNSAYILMSQPLEAGNSNPFTDGETIQGLTSGATTEYVDYATSIRSFGNFTYISHMLTMGAGYKNSAVAIGNREKAQNGLPLPPYTARYVRAANGIDPNNTAEATTKSGFENGTNSGLTAAEMANSFFDDVKVHNWGAASNDRNLTGLTPSELDEVTLGGWNDDRLSQAIGTSTTVDAIAYLRTLRNPGLLAPEIWSYAAPAFGDPTIGHTAGVTALFSPDLAGDGFRMDGINNWSIGGQPDYPVDGDNCDLDDNLAYNFMTWRFADLDFGTAGTGGVRLYGGFISCTTAQGSGSIDLRESGQFYFAGTNAATVTVTATGGRLGFTGATVGGTIDVALSGQAQVFVQGGSSATVRDMTLTGNDCVVGFDGTTGTAALTVTGALHFAGIAKMIERRSGDHGLEDLGGGVEGQPIDPAVTSSVTLAGTCVVTVDTTGLAAGSYDLIDVDSLTDNGATLPAGVAVSGNTLVLTV